MSRIKFLVTGIDNAVLGSIIGTLAMGELEGPADIVVVPQPTPKAYAIGNGGATKEISFSEFLSVAVVAERKRVAERLAAPGEKLVQEIVEKSSKHDQVHEPAPVALPFKPKLVQ